MTSAVMPVIEKFLEFESGPKIEEMSVVFVGNNFAVTILWMTEPVSYSVQVLMIEIEDKVAKFVEILDTMDFSEPDMVVSGAFASAL